MTIKVVSRGFQVDGGRFAYADDFVFTSDPRCRDYDWLVAYDDLPEPERLGCPRRQTILATSEPVSIKGYSRGFTRQFGHLLTNRPAEAESHPCYHLGRGYYKWFYGRTHAEAAAMRPPEKTKGISVVCSSKRMRHTRHFERLRLIEHLSRNLPELDWFGHGVRAFDSKCAVTDPYRYQVVVENHMAPHHWTEKLTDAFLGWCLPFYAGAPDLADDFPRDSFIPIPVDDPGRALGIIRSAMADDAYGRRREALCEARRLVLEKYNFYAQVIAVIRGAEQDPGPAAGCLYPRRAMRWRDPRCAVEDAVWRVKRMMA